ncbi:WXG100 family type VII secretion target [Actinomadura sp. GC306]|uniref:WXG100 family type VII secretion target n=1 Tax=Actinomadura sp. GC306 TaxID=2530367 RepID=UPI0010452BC5|nr:WXG100 family type VII secretion target [Actinomadura sp. GC306]TDC66579.1 WXG100 family type VII secretion target [Actinomadura sp. GC306]
MSQKSSVDRAEMAQAAQRVEEAAQDLRKIQGDLGQEQAQLSGRWIGEAGSAFTRVYNEFNGELGKVLEVLNGLHEKLVQVKINYEGSEQQQTEAVNRVAGLLNG